MSLGLTQLNADGSPSSEYVLGASQARDGIEVLADHYPAGSGTPAVVVVDTDRMLEVTAAVLAVEGVDHVRIATLGGPSPITAEGIQPFAAGAGIAQAPIIVDDQVLLEVTLDSAADSPQAEQTVREMRVALDAIRPDILVGGQTADRRRCQCRGARRPRLDRAARACFHHDHLVFLLRSVVAPLLIIGSVALSFAAALGVSALVFNHVFGFSGADPTVPLVRLRLPDRSRGGLQHLPDDEGARRDLHHGPREGVLRSLVLTGGVITSAGVVLAATFAALGILPLLFLAQIAFIVAFGVLLDTFVVRTLLVPALAYELDPAPGGRVGWRADVESVLVDDGTGAREDVT